MKTDFRPPLIVICLLAVAFGDEVSFPVIGSPVTGIVYVYESETSSVPVHVASAFGKLGDERETRIIDDDVITGEGGVPEHLKAAIAAARNHGLPSIVLLSNDDVSSVHDVPKSREEIEALVK